MKLTMYISRFLNRVRLFGKISHLYRMRKARKVLKKLHEIAKVPNSNGKLIVYLRKINPFVFEELVLTVIEESNIRIIRNKRYTGDGGIDGIFKVKAGKVLIQCKRYGSYINNADVKDLCAKVKAGKYHFGIFVHTGKTGDKAKDTMRVENNILFVSGSVLIDLILGKLHIERHIDSHKQRVAHYAQNPTKAIDIVKTKTPPTKTKK
jgi:restriction system protein